MRPADGSRSNHQTIAKRCRCGRTFTREQWLELPYLGVQCFRNADGESDLELRNCPCGSTLANEIPCQHALPCGVEAP